ncbi:MAG: hypothetical protein JXA66_08810 [Oligoflexia bacterium]|nr:hypothetical protein [Oligoflexia bacterium]
MKRLRTLISVMALAALMGACGEKRVRTSQMVIDPQEPLPREGVTFIAGASGTTATVTMYDNYLKALIEDDIDPDSYYEPSSHDDAITWYHARFDLVLENVDYNGENISVIECPENIYKQLFFNVETPAELLNLVEVPVIMEVELTCTDSEGETYYVKIFQANGFAQAAYALYFDFLQTTVRGRVNVKRVGDADPVGVHFE